MAQTTKDFFRVFGLLSILFLVQQGHAFQYKVGGSNGWTLPSDPNAAIYNPWAQKNRFQIGDSLLFVYPADQDSVLHVTEDDYTNCKTESPLDKFTDGHSVYEFKNSGPHYFISGVAEHCHKNEKLNVVVMADRSNRSSKGAAPPPEAVSPPSPAPAGEVSPSPPSPAPSDDSTPPSPGSEAPSEESSHPKNGAHSVAGNVVGVVAILAGALLALAV